MNATLVAGNRTLSLRLCTSLTAAELATMLNNFEATIAHRQIISVGDGMTEGFAVYADILSDVTTSSAAEWKAV